MLVLTCNLNEAIVIDGNIVIKLLAADRRKAVLGIQAPPEVRVDRAEIARRRLEAAKP